MGKGSKRRPTDEPSFRKGWEGIFGLMRQDKKRSTDKQNKESDDNIATIRDIVRTTKIGKKEF